MRSLCHTIARYHRLLMGVGVVSVIATAGRPVRAADLDASREQFKTGQYAKCLESAQKAVDEGAYQTQWRTLAIRSLMALGRYDEAAQYVDSFMRHSRPDMELLVQAYRAYRYNGQSAQAETMLAIAYRIATRSRTEYMSSDDMVALGQCLLLMGAEPRMVLDDFYGRALDSDPDCRDAYLAAGDLAVAKQDYDLAANQYRDGLARFGDDPDLHYGLARAFYHSDRAAMLQSLNAAMVVNPHHAPTLILMAEHLIDGEQYDVATQTLKRLLDVNPWHPKAWACRAVLAHLAADPNAFERYRANALKFWPANPEVDCLIGMKLSQKYRFAEGAAAQRRALAMDPDYLPAKIQLAQDLLRLGDEQEGWALAEEVNEKDPYNVEAYNLASLYDKSKGFKTVRSENFIVRMDPLEADVYGDEVIELLEKAKKTLCDKYGIELDRPATLELFANQQDFAVRTFGIPGGDGFLGVCFGNVITANSPKLERPANWKATLWHEYCHVVTLNMTANKMPRWLSEGISVYEEQQQDPTWGQRMNPQYRDMILNGELTPIGRLSSAFLSPDSPLHLQFAYYESSLAVEFLVERFGFDAIKAILTDLRQGREINAAIAEHTEPIEKLEKDFETFARTRAEGLAPKLDWSKPPQEADDEEALKQWVAEHPENFWALRRQAGQFMADRKWEQAKEPLETLIDLYPEYVGEDNAYMALAQVHRQLDETDREAAVLTKLAARSADASAAYARLMEIGIERKDWQQVATNGRKYLAVYPLLETLHWRLGQAYEHLREKSQAVRSYERLLLLDPADPVEVNYRLARLLQEEDTQAARRHLLEALADAPRFRKGHQLLLEMRQTPESATSQENAP